MWSRTQGVESERSALAAANANFYRSAEAKLWARGLVAVASWAALPVGSLRVVSLGSVLTLLRAAPLFI